MKKLKKTTGIIFLLTTILLSFSCDKEVSVSPPDPPVHTGFLSVNSNPMGAAIYLNGKNTGRHTPDSLNWMEENNYNVTLKYPYFRDTTFMVRIDEKVKKDTFVDYFLNPSMYGKISCSTDPQNAEIYLDGEKSGKVTPFTFENIVPGSHKVKYRYEGCRDDSMKLIVESSKTRAAFLKLVDTTIWLTYNTSNSKIPNNSISVILVDQNDVKWAGTLGGGVVSFDGMSWKSFNTKNSNLPNDFVTCMAFDNNMHLWAGTNNGLAEFNGTSWTVYKTENGVLPDNFITSICVDRNGIKWVGTGKGLVKIDGTKWTVFTTSNSALPNDGIQCVAADFNGVLWAGVQTVGLVTYNKNTWTSITKENSGLPGHDVTALAVGQFLEGVWAGFSRTLPRGSDEGGLAVRENGVWYNNYYSKLPSTTIHSITIKDNIKWVCTEGGLIKFFTSSRWEVLNTANTQLPTNSILSVGQDSRGYLWIGTAGYGLVKYKMQ